MFTLVFFILLSAIITIRNKQNEISEDNENSYKFDSLSIYIILGCIILSFALNFIFKKITFLYSYFFIGLGVFSFISGSAIIASDYFRIKKIEKTRDELRQIYEILDNLAKNKNEEIDFNNNPFELEYDKKTGQITKITLNIDDVDKFTDASMTQAIHKCNKFLPYRQWVCEPDFPERICCFIGNKLPPNIANYPGSDLRPSMWIPLGLSGIGEIAWNLGANQKDLGESLYIYEDTGLKAGTVNISKAPQALCVGSTGGGKAIDLQQYVKVKKL